MSWEGLNKLEKLWQSFGIDTSKGVSYKEIADFESKNNLKIPKDLSDFFILLNGTKEKYDHKSFEFKTLNQFKNIKEELSDYSGIPDYSNIVNTIQNPETYYLIADYSFFVCCYAIKLYSCNNSNNDIIVIWGDKYKKISDSFSEFINLYLNDKIEIFP